MAKRRLVEGVAGLMPHKFCFANNGSWWTLCCAVQFLLYACCNLPSRRWLRCLCPHMRNMGQSSRRHSVQHKMILFTARYWRRSRPWRLRSLQQFQRTLTEASSFFHWLGCAKESFQVRGALKHFVT
jgi:hypothetical protein